MRFKTKREATTAMRAIEPERKIEASRVKVDLKAGG
ncbi:MAG: KEOPS complex subunit Pcc1, partial [Candidatus Hadarchaeales archaeon]